ncbi:hypothetical protein PGN35_028575 [Nodosilinea sp. PGN35]|uniref:hypothetical protein n=1 Tax=Nodosilinea sp. PGN35 TaxID=3020489 RepID=UPI0023B20D38|nr:hypothetical protein [Nodosilinea sp. TSF1-S3]MDF0365395.1 hypothetical protein [Nodosilinea sp. TSF1-S3]
MLCTSCSNKPRCVAAQLAEGDAALAQLLKQLRHCSLKPSRRRLWPPGTALRHWLVATLRPGLGQ